MRAFSDSDPNTRGGDRLLAAMFLAPIGTNRSPSKASAIFLQEDKGEEPAGVVGSLVRKAILTSRNTPVWVKNPFHTRKVAGSMSN